MPKTMFMNNIEYSASDFVDLFGKLTTNGVCGTNDLKVIASTPNALTVDVSIGKMFVNGHYVNWDTTTKLPITSNTSGFTRKDIVCMKVNTNNNTTSVVVIQGTPSSSPATPVPPSVSGENYVVLAEVTIGNNVSTITSGNIVDKRIVAKIWDDYNTTLIDTESGYFRFPNGLIVQWGKVQNVANNDTIRFTFPIAFIDKCYSIMLSPQWTATANHTWVTGSTDTKTYWDLKKSNNVNSSDQVRVFIIGR